MRKLLKGIEKKVIKDHDFIIGVDEAGRGALAGPVTAGACCLLPNFDISGIKDSKKMSVNKREELYDNLVDNTDILYSTSNVTNDVIDEINILEATMVAMAECVSDVHDQIIRLYPTSSVYVLVDGNKYPDGLKHLPGEAIIKGDDKCYTISTASIFAKVSRDRLMKEYNKQEKYSFWEFDKNKGYYRGGKSEHGEKIKTYRFGSDLHRKSFNPLKKILKKNKEVIWNLVFEKS